MLKNPRLKTDLEVLLENGNLDAVRGWFSFWDDEDELIDKVLLFGHTVLSHYFKSASPEFHRDIIGDLFSDDNEYDACPRGFAKTTTIQASVMFMIINKTQKFIPIIEKSFTEAAEVIKGIRDEFADNQLLIAIWGNLLPSRKAMEHLTKDPDSEGDVVINGVRLRGKGFETTIRGLKYRETRPTIIILDDVETDEHIKNPDQRQKYLDNYNKGIQPAVDIDGSIKVFGTILHQDSLLMNLIKSHNGRIYRAYDPKDPINTLLWADRWSYEKLETKKKDMMTAGKSSSAFAQEYLNDPVSDEERTFKYGWLYEDIIVGEVTYKVPKRRITMDEFDLMRMKMSFNVYALIDVADSTGELSDWTGVVVFAVNAAGNIFLLHCKREKRNINGKIDLVFEIWQDWKGYGLQSINIEKKAFHDEFEPLIEAKKEEKNLYPILSELEPMKRNKEARIKGALQGRFEHGKIIAIVDIKNEIPIPRGHTMMLLEELYDFPSANHDDLSDALAYSVDVMVIPEVEKEKSVRNRVPQDDAFEDSNEGYNDSKFNEDPYQ